MKIGKWYIEPFDSGIEKYGVNTAHWRIIGKLFHLDYLRISIDFGLCKKSIYYDGYHHCIVFGLFSINWGGWPYRESKN